MIEIFQRYFHERHGYCFPDGASVCSRVDTEVPEAERAAVWEELGRYWLEKLRRCLGGGYRVIESEHFLLLTAAPDRIVADAGRFYEDRKIEVDRRPSKASLLAFVGSAEARDGGASACRLALGVDLGDLVAEFLGDGRWAPRPDDWEFVSYLP